MYLNLGLLEYIEFGRRVASEIKDHMNIDLNPNLSVSKDCQNWCWFNYPYL